LIWMVWCGPTPKLYAEETASVAIFPFSVQAPQSHEALATDLPRMIGINLENEGTRIVYVTEYLDTEPWNAARFRQEGIRLGVDHIITGNIFIAGSQISIDTNMHPVYETRPPLPFFSQSDSLEELHGAAANLSRAIIGELFEKRIITTISVTGNRRVDTDAVLRVITSSPGDIMNQEKLSKDLEQVYQMGFFDDVVVKKNELDQGVEIVFSVTEKPSVRNIKFSQNRVYKDDELAAVVDTSTGSILNVYKINSDVERIKRLYTEKNYHNCLVHYEITPLDNNQADIAAPGVDIVSVEAGASGLTSMSGTSMATPHVAGVAVLWAQRQMEMTGRVEHLSLLAQLVASGTRDGLVADSEEDDVGTGLVQAPLT
ncbi:MAG: hypothetical protein EOM10_12595, partial [Opitutae bacterium]|nr:hypothetical protein [Opitutae bacterium]